MMPAQTRRMARSPVRLIGALCPRSPVGNGWALRRVRSVSRSPLGLFFDRSGFVCSRPAAL